MKRSTSSLVIFVIVLILVGTLPVLAQSQRVSTSSLGHFKKVYDSAIQTGSLRTPARYTTRIAGFGRVKFRFDQVEASGVVPEIITSSGVAYDTNPVILLKGRAKTVDGWKRATGTIARQASGLKLTTTFNTRRRISSQINSITLEYPNVLQRQPEASLQRTNSVSLKNAVCALDHTHVAPLGIPGPTVVDPDADQAIVSPAGAKVLELSIHADASYIASHGSESQYILARINEVEAIYEDQFEISFEVKRLQFDSTLDLGSTNAGTMIENFQAHLNGRGLYSSADLFHLFTATNLVFGGSDLVVGIAYQSAGDSDDPGVVCRYDNELTVGITERQASFSTGLVSVVFAHEMGHNFSLEHVASGIMAAAADPDDLPTAFSNDSVTALLDYIDTHNACLSSESVDPDPTPTDSPDGGGTGGGNGSGGGGPTAVPVNLTASLSRAGEFEATMSLDSEPPDGCSLKLVIGKNRNRLNYRRKILAEELVDDVLTFTYTAGIYIKTPTETPRGRPLRFFVQAFLDCSDSSDSGFSPVRRIRPDLVVARRMVGFKAYANRLKCRIEGGDCSN